MEKELIERIQSLIDTYSHSYEMLNEDIASEKDFGNSYRIGKRSAYSEIIEDLNYVIGDMI